MEEDPVLERHFASLSSLHGRTVWGQWTRAHGRATCACRPPSPRQTMPAARPPVRGPAAPRGGRRSPRSDTPRARRRRSPDTRAGSSAGPAPRVVDAAGVDDRERRQQPHAGGDEATRREGREMIAHQAKVGEVQRRQVPAERRQDRSAPRSPSRRPGAGAAPAGPRPTPEARARARAATACVRRRRPRPAPPSPRTRAAGAGVRASADAGRAAWPRSCRSPRAGAAAPRACRGACGARRPRARRQHPATLAEAPAEVHVLAEAEAFAQPAELLVDGAPHQQVAGGRVQAVRPALRSSSRAPMSSGEETSS